VPYAFKAHEAETLGGLPASAFVKATETPPLDVSNGTSFNALSHAANAGVRPRTHSLSSAETRSTTPSGVSGFVPIVDSTLTNIGNSTIWQDSLTPAHLGIGTTVTDPGFKIKIFDPKWPNIAISGLVGASTKVASGILAIATCPACFAVRAQPGDFIVSASSGSTGSLILEANDYNNASIQFATGVTANADTKMTLTRDGNFGVGIVNPTSAFAVGDWTTSHNSNPPPAPFQLDKNGDMVAIKNVPYSWPTGHGSLGSVLTDTTGNGGLAWGPAPLSATCNTPNYVPKWNSSPNDGTLGCSNIQDGPGGISMQDSNIFLTAVGGQTYGRVTIDGAVVKIGNTHGSNIETAIEGPGGFVDVGPAGTTIQGTLVLINAGGAPPRHGSGCGCTTIIGGGLVVEGDLQVTGTLTKGAGSFKIDHPLDAENKTLSHSFVESPDMMNVYNGNVTTDKRGLATVVLPDYFEALNRDFRYQLSVIGQFAQAIIGKEISQNRFTIRTDKPRVKVSWQVTGIRQDAYANAHRIPIEEDKPETERGTYLHPELFGASRDSKVAARATR
jgi:hypothetical protein